MTEFTATYSPEDNKLRLYADRRLDAETHARVKSLGFKWAPKQELFVAPKWTPKREDLCVELAGEIEPEGTTLAERAEAKAERLDALADKRERQSNAFLKAADDLSQAFPMGQPILVGHHSERKARRTQERMHNNMDKAVRASKAVQHWQWKAAGVERHANHKNSERTRANRIKTLLAELRDHQRDLNHAALCLKVWEKATTDEAITKMAGAYLNKEPLCYWDHYRAFSDGKLTAQDLRDISIRNSQAIVDSPSRHRWIDHILNRLAYERELLGPVDRFEGTLTPVILQAFAREHGAMKPTAKASDLGFELTSTVLLPLHLANSETLELSADGWRELMQAVGYTVPAEKPALPPILNFRANGQQLIGSRGDILGRKDTFAQVEMTKERYRSLPSFSRWTETSACGTFRFKIGPDPDFKGPYYSCPRVAIFLTDSKEHPIPESLQSQSEAA
ncbi:DUF3560 domain-containing protein [Roseibium polysiphoniae]|uniref:DUF3560 domain-containing protein n=1 Tax=Roseibium polysiphoniae TaxID=2571221 RepID=UPI003297B6B9